MYYPLLHVQLLAHWTNPQYHHLSTPKVELKEPGGENALT